MNLAQVAVSIPSSAPSPRWLGAAELPPAADAAVRDWLFDQGSLTRRLTALAGRALRPTAPAPGGGPPA
ncbi:chorismate lyase, partial [Pseudomonas sp. PS02288]|uniref:chorismate lyase n=1 Tax=Pseudomonas sp. PS02288 TaxID=2991443 RepID=UPI00249B9905